MEEEYRAPCESYCEHGGCCHLPRRHEGLHDSGYCQWDDDRALSKAEADAVYESKGGGVFLGLENALRDMFEEE